MPTDDCSCHALGVTKNTLICQLCMLTGDYECLGMTANMTILIELTPFFICDVLLTLIEKG